MNVKTEDRFTFHSLLHIFCFFYFHRICSFKTNILDLFMCRYLISLVTKLIRTLRIICTKLAYRLIVLKYWNPRLFAIYLSLVCVSTLALVYYRSDGNFNWHILTESILDFDDHEVIQVDFKTNYSHSYRSFFFSSLV